jgi:hypothetical protein
MPKRDRVPLNVADVLRLDRYLMCDLSKLEDLIGIGHGRK